MSDPAREIIEAAERLGDTWLTMLTALDTLHASLGGVGGRIPTPQGLPLLPVKERKGPRDQRGAA